MSASDGEGSAAPSRPTPRQAHTRIQRSGAHGPFFGEVPSEAVFAAIPRGYESATVEQDNELAAPSETT